MSKFYGSLDAQEYNGAYDLFGDGAKKVIKLVQFSNAAAEFHRVAGHLKKRQVNKVTWTKDPSNAAEPGVYAFVDIVSQFENVDRHCGYMVLFQKIEGGDFAVAREESNYIANATADSIATTKSAQEVESLWAQMSRNCPNYTAAAR
jgi:hypothetical protein